jgi:carboxyl-terminal processing protease
MISPVPLVLEVPRTTVRYEGVPLARRIESGVVGVGAVGYIELPWDGGWGDYATRTQRAIRAVDEPETCGWIVDVRRNIGGDFWTYVAGIGPILAEGDLGGFVFPSGAREGWSYRAGKVLWDARQRDESYVADPIYGLKRQMPPVAVLTSHATFAAGALVRVALQGRPATRSFGEA